MREIYVYHISPLVRIGYVLCVVQKIKFYFSKVIESFLLESHCILAEEKAFAIPLRFSL